MTDNRLHVGNYVTADTVCIRAKHAERHDIDLTHAGHQIPERRMTKMVLATVKEVSDVNDLRVQRGGVRRDFECDFVEVHLASVRR